MVKVRRHLWRIRGDRGYIPPAEKVCDETCCVLGQWLLWSTRGRDLLRAKDLLTCNVEELPDILDASSFGLVVGAGDEIFDFLFMGLEGGMDMFDVEARCTLKLGKDQPEHETSADLLVEGEPVPSG